MATQNAVFNPTRSTISDHPDRAVVRPRKSSVEIQILNEDVLIAHIDRTASRKKILADLRQVLKNLVPGRSIDSRIPMAIRLKNGQGISYVEASVRMFGDPSWAYRIRYHSNLRERSKLQ